MLLQLMLYAFSTIYSFSYEYNLTKLIDCMVFIILQCYGPTGIDCPQTYFWWRIFYLVAKTDRFQALHPAKSKHRCIIDP